MPPHAVTPQEEKKSNGRIAWSGVAGRGAGGAPALVAGTQFACFTCFTSTRVRILAAEKAAAKGEATSLCHVARGGIQFSYQEPHPELNFCIPRLGACCQVAGVLQRFS